MAAAHERDDGASTGSDAALVRPYLSRTSVFTPTHEGDHDVADLEVTGVRSYAITGGRSTGVVQLEFESMMQTTTLGRAALDRLHFERATISRMCSTEILSVAELSARLHLPIGVVRVVAADLVFEGLLQAFLSTLSVADDVSLITRLIEGVRAL